MIVLVNEFSSIEKVSIFGNSALTSTGVFSSDDYGVFVYLQFDK
ncbi:hypothetical protein OCA21_06895 [Bacillus cereus]|nr:MULTISPECIES: hypothetical protein [Bacillus]MCU5105581.1 hypothetical protein [Bacillus cereus]